jgi:hypothetical protein
MMPAALLAPFAACLAAAALPPPAALLLAVHLFLIGDAGEPAADEPVLRALAGELSRAPDSSVVVVLGDNLYPKGLPPESDPDFAEMARRIDAQVDVVRAASVRTIFIPGNHDWDRSGPAGLDRVRAQEARVESRGGAGVRWLPDGGCPGPVVVDDLHPSIRLVVLDTQWWLHPNETPGEGSPCGVDTEAEFTAAVREAVSTANGRRVLVVGHHPIASRGRHGGHYDFVDHVFPLRGLASWLWVPLPGVGSLYPVARRNGLSPQDLSAGGYRALRDSLLAAFSAAPPFLYASGHDHSLQLLDGPAELGPAAPRHLVVSGAGIFGHTSKVDRDDTRFATSDAGFFRLDVEPDGRLVLRAFVADGDGTAREAWSGRLE